MESEKRARNDSTAGIEEGCMAWTLLHAPGRRNRPAGFIQRLRLSSPAALRNPRAGAFFVPSIVPSILARQEATIKEKKLFRSPGPHWPGALLSATVDGTVRTRSSKRQAIARQQLARQHASFLLDGQATPAGSCDKPGKRLDEALIAPDFCGEFQWGTRTELTGMTSSSQLRAVRKT